MVASTVQLKGKLTVKVPTTLSEAAASGEFDVSTDLLESLSARKQLLTAVSLDADGAGTLNMADITNAALIFIKTDGAVTVRITSGAGVAQAFVVDKCFFLMCTGTPVTAITLQRAAGVLTSCKVLLAEV